MDPTALSKQLSRILRHRPDSVGIRLDSHGWCDVDELLLALGRKGTPVTRELLQRLVDESDKRRFVLDGERIRAAQGHSAAGVKPLLREKVPPSRLFHGTIASNLESIGKKGLLPLNRHHVHLSPDEATAQTVGKRRGIAVVLVVDSARMSRDGHKFFVSANDVWLVAAVPAKYLTLPI